MTEEGDFHPRQGFPGALTFEPLDERGRESGEADSEVIRCQRTEEASFGVAMQHQVRLGLVVIEARQQAQITPRAAKSVNTTTPSGRSGCDHMARMAS